MESILRELQALRDADYAAFQARLIPNLPPERILGVRMPRLRAYAKTLLNDSRRAAFLEALPHSFYDENQLHALLLNSICKDLPQSFSLLEAFLPHVDNWATCDTLSIRIFARYPDPVYEKCLEWLQSPHCYTVRFAIDVLLKFYLGAEFRPESLELLACLGREEYYINMAIAWYMSYALASQYESTLPLFQQKRLDKWLHNKSIQKAIESRRIPEERKETLRGLRR
ncbi:MAG: DNA alkylation repair protein [Firmicutes bacterium]|nr:DNA alkylation repair protein [Bacillota bacterium]